MSLNDRGEPGISAPHAVLASQLLTKPTAVPPQLRPAPSGPSNCSAPDSLGLFALHNDGVLPDQCAESLDNTRHDLRAPSLAQQNPGLGLFASGVRARPALNPPALPGAIGTPPGHLGKRHSAAEKSAVRALGSPTKKPRLVAPGHLSLPPASQTLDQLVSARPATASPLFFSSSPRPVMVRPPDFSTSEVAASMMTDNENPDGVTTVRLPKGQVSAISPAMSSGTPQSWSSADLSSLSRSPDGWPQPSVVQLLQGIGIVELLEQDERPTFIIDLNDPANFSSGPLHIIFANAVLRAAPKILGLLQPETASEPKNSSEFIGFKAWAVSLARDKTWSSNPSPSSITYAGLSWTCSTLRRRFRIIRGYNNTTASTPTSPSPATQPQPLAVSDVRFRGPWTGQELGAQRERNDYFGSTGAAHVRSHSEPRSRAGSATDTVVRPFDDLALATPELRTTFDWTRIPIDDPNLPAHYRFARSVNWAATPLGPVELWSPELRILSSMIMGSPHPAALYWGPEHVAIYNEAYISLAGQKHPQLMGSRYKDAWSEIWDEIEPVFDGAWNRACATMKYDDTLFIDRR